MRIIAFVMEMGASIAYWEAARRMQDVAYFGERAGSIVGSPWLPVGGQKPNAPP